MAQLLFLGREYPQGYEYFRTRCKAAFERQRSLTDPAAIDKAIAHGEYIVKELEALYFLRKYREMRRRYYGPEDAPTIADGTVWLREPAAKASS